MIVVFIILAGTALIAAGVTGWLVAARAARASRFSLEDARTGAEQRTIAAEVRVEDLLGRERSLEAELTGVRKVATEAREQLREAQAALAAAQHTATTAEQDARTAQQRLAETQQRLTETQQRLTDVSTAQAAQQAELASVRERLAAAEKGRDREGRAVQEVQRVLAPLFEKERLASELARIDMGRGTRGELPRLMDTIAKIGNFSSVVLSDDSGLPLAMNQSSEDGEMLAGLWSMLLTISDRVGRSGAPVPTALVVHDAANQTMLHRLFSSAGNQFLLTAVSRGRTLPPETLDPALDKLERILARSALAAS